MHKRLRKPRFLFVYPLAALLFAVGRITEQNLRSGILIIALGELLRVWANGYVGHVKVNWTQKWRGDAKIGRLITGGPYAFVRHPLYLGTALIGSGFCLIVGSAWLALPAFIGFLLIYRAKMAEEERTLLNECDSVYQRYHAAVPRLLPVRGRFADRHGRWSWKGVAASKEWKTAIWVTVVVILLYFWEEAVQERQPLFEERWLMHACLLGVLAALIATDG
ncbi:MAG: methyltransferase family protein, partial [bacterium]